MSQKLGQTGGLPTGIHIFEVLMAKLLRAHCKLLRNADDKVLLEFTASPSPKVCIPKSLGDPFLGLASLTASFQASKPERMEKVASLRLNLARKYRPQSLDEMKGQANVIRILQEALKSDRIAPAYLFSGPRGVGKTSSARIFAKAASCLHENPAKRPCQSCRSCEAIKQGKMMDILEIDGASHTGVDDVRSLIESVAYRPSIGAKNIYIVDEVHMLSNAAFNALLKTLEEPPPHVLFLFATTEPEKLPTTILSRVQRLELQRLKEREIFENLREISTKEKIKISDSVLEQIATAADGSLRDAQTLLEQMILLSASMEVSEEIVDTFLGTIGTQQEIELLQLISKQDVFPILEKIHLYSEKGKDLTKLLSRLVHWTRCLLVSRAAQTTSLFDKDCPQEALEKLLLHFKDWSTEDLDRLFEVIWTGYERLKRSDLPKISLETTLIRACRIPRTMDLARLLEHLESFPSEPQPAVFKSPVKAPNAKFEPALKEQPQRKQPHTSKTNSAEDAPKGWEAALQVLKKSRPSLFALIQCAAEQDLNEDRLKLVFPEGHFAFRQLSDPLMTKDLEKTLNEIFKKKIKIELLQSMADTSTNFTPAPKTDLIREAKKQIVGDPEIQRAAEILKGKISSVTIEGIKT